MARGGIYVLAGDFKKGAHHGYDNCFFMKNESSFRQEKIPDSFVEKLEIASEKSVVSKKGAVGWGLAGEALLGPVGMIAGVMFGGKKGKIITFICKFKDGREFIGTTSEDMFSWMQKRVLVSNFEAQRKLEGKTAQNDKPAPILVKAVLYTIVTIVALAWLVHK